MPANRTRLPLGEAYYELIDKIWEANRMKEACCMHGLLTKHGLAIYAELTKKERDLFNKLLLDEYFTCPLLQRNLSARLSSGRCLHRIAPLSPELSE